MIPISHAAIFFSRTQAIGQVIAGLNVQASMGTGFLLVLGMSGSGKSSLVQAGVLPLLTQPGLIEGVGLWRVVLMRPGHGRGSYTSAGSPVAFKYSARNATHFDVSPGRLSVGMQTTARSRSLNSGSLRSISSITCVFSASPLMVSLLGSCFL